MNKTFLVSFAIVFLLVSSASASISQNIIHAWDWNNDTNDITDKVGTADAIKNGAPTWKNSTDCVSNGCFETTGTGGTDATFYTNQLNLNTSDSYTLAFWANFSTITNGGYYILSIGDGGTKNLYLATGGTVGAQIVVGYNGGSTTNVATFYVDGTYHLYILTYNATNHFFQIFFDNNANDEGNGTGALGLTETPNLYWLDNGASSIGDAGPHRIDNTYFWKNKLLDATERSTLYNGGVALNYPFAAASVASFDNITFANQMPADITGVTPFQYPNVTVTYTYFNRSNITLPFVLNISVVSTILDCIDYNNGSCSLLNNTWMKITNITNMVNGSGDTTNVTFLMDENDLFPHNENFEIFTNFIYSTQTLSLSGTGLDDWHREEFQNFSLAANYTIILEMPVSTTGLANIYMGNTSFTEGSNPAANVNVFEACVVLSTDTGNHSHSYNGTVYNHTLCRVPVVNGEVAGVKITKNMSVFTRSTTGVASVFAIDGLVRANSARTSTNNGGSWSDSSNSFIHIHSFSGSDSVTMQAFSNRTNGVFLNSSTRTDTYQIDTTVPTIPSISFPVNGENVNSSVNITYITSGTNVFYNITLLNSDLTFNKTIVANNSNNLNYEWLVYNETEVYLGTYFVQVTAKNSLGIAIDIEQLNVTRNAMVNISAIGANGGATINSFSGWIYHVETGTNDSFATSNGRAWVPTLRGNLTVFVDATNFSTSGNVKGVNTTIGLTDVQFSLFETNTLNITFYDEAANTVVLNGTFIELEIISDLFSNNFSTTNGTMYLTLLTPETYTLRYTAAEYTERFYTVTVTNRSFSSINLYLISNNVSQNVTVSVVDEVLSPVEGARVKALKYDLSTNTFILQEIGETNVEGEVVMSLTLNDEFYRFKVEVDGVVKVTTSPAYITSTLLTIQIQLAEELGDDLFDFFGIQSTLVYNQATNNFRLEYNDASGISSQICMNVYRGANFSRTLINNTCDTGSSGIILLGVVPKNDTEVTAEAFYTQDGVQKYLNGASFAFPKSDVFGTYGVFLQLALFIAAAAILRSSMALAAIMMPFTLFLGSWLGFHTLSTSVLVIMQILGVLIAYILTYTKR